MDHQARRILIVEDDAVLLRASALALERAGYTVVAASGGREGLAAARADLPDLIVLDLLMPRPTGLEVFRALKAQASTRRIPVLVVSNSSMQRIVEEVESFGDEYIVKANLSLRELADRVKGRLARPILSFRSRAPQAPESDPAMPVAADDDPPEPPVAEAPSVAEAPPAPEALPVPDDIPEVDEPLDEAVALNCAGCGFSVGARFDFCPRCGRKLAGPRSWSAQARRVR